MLRRARLKAGLTLRDVQKRSNRRFTVSALGSYERGERSVTLERFCELVSLYEMPPERILARIVDEIPAPFRSRYVIDLRDETTENRTP